MQEPSNGFRYRLDAIERRLSRMEDLEPAVMKAQLADVKEDIHAVASELAGIRKVLTGFFVTFAFTGITIVIGIVALTQ